MRRTAACQRPWPMWPRCTSGRKARSAPASWPGHRNGVISFSDHMNAYHAQMELLLDDGPAQTAQSAGLLRLLGQAGALDYLARRLRSEAPATLAADAEFGRLLAAVEQSVAALMQALLAQDAAQDAAQAREALGRLKKPYSQLFLKFG